jgi:two-component system chemotaxis response regulator CheB
MLDAIAIGGSAGALEPLFEILKELPSAISAPVIVVMHVLPNHPSLIPELLEQACPDRIVHEAEDKEPLQRRTIYVAPPNYHLLVEHDRTFALSVDDPVNFSRPSIDVLFESAADAFGHRLVGVLLSGSNADGAAGLAAIVRQGGAAIVQADASYPTMPEAGLHRAPTARALTPAEIGPLLAALESAP